MAAVPSTQEQLDAVQIAIHELTTKKVKAYTLEGRSLTYLDLPWLEAREAKLLARLSAEQSGGTRTYASFGGRGI
jgi:hypothetical protein